MCRDGKCQSGKAGKGAKCGVTEDCLVPVGLAHAVCRDDECQSGAGGESAGQNSDCIPLPTPLGSDKDEVGWSSYIDTSDRALRYGPHKYGHDPLSCASACGYYKYIALQNNGWCSCDNDLYHATQYGQAQFCGGLGGSWCNYIYNNPFALEKVGAYFDDKDDRALSVDKGYGYDPHRCAMACIGHNYIGLQDFKPSTGSRCFCHTG